MIHLVMVHKVKELSCANLGVKVLVPGDLDDGVQMRLLLFLSLLLLICLFSLQQFQA